MKRRRPTPRRKRRSRAPVEPFPRPEHRLPPLSVLESLDAGDERPLQEWRREQRKETNGG